MTALSFGCLNHTEGTEQALCLYFISRTRKSVIEAKRSAGSRQIKRNRDRLTNNEKKVQRNRLQ
jgi:pyridoxine/pyridoxamine 5'-phosphate oxidase